MEGVSGFKGSKAFVTGGLGFVGSNVAQALAGDGAEVTVYDACLDPFGWNFANISEIRERVKFVKGDVRDASVLASSIKGCSPDYVFHCAAQVSHLDSMADPFLDLDINCRGTLTLLEACRRHASQAKIVYAGTRAQVGRQEYSPVDEKHPTEPVDVYGVDKLAAEKYVLLYGRAYGMRACSLRMTNLYGPRHQMRHGKYGILNWFVRKALLGEAIEVYGDGSQLRDYLYVDDAVEAMLLAAAGKEADGEVFLLGSQEPVRFIDMVKAVIAAAGMGTYVLKPWPEERKKIETGDFVMSAEKIRGALGWRPRTPFQEGLGKTVAFYRKRLEEYL